jgi:hypothetical protein
MEDVSESHSSCLSHDSHSLDRCKNSEQHERQIELGVEECDSHTDAHNHGINLGG